MFGVGALAERYVVKEELVERIPDNLSYVDAAALANSAVNAMLAISDAQVTKGQRVLVIGGTGGIGNALVQLLLDAEVSFLAATSTDVQLLRDLGVHRAIDYTQEKWWEIPEFATDKFDHIFDCAEGRSAWRRCGPVLKSGSDGGRFCAVVPQEWQINIEHYWGIVPFIVPVLWRALWTSCVPPLTPRYRMLQGAPRGRSLVDLLRKVDEGRIRAIIDPHGPFPCTTEGVRAAFELHQSRRGKGKVVILVQHLEGEGNEATPTE
jgi:NADPH:quinone reductase-like Zn-dependent oxidoreductase